MPYHVLVDYLRIEFRMVEHVRTRSYDAHVPLQDVEELRELVEICLAHEMAEGEFARVVLRSLFRVRLPVDVHAAELVTQEGHPVQPRPLLSEKHGAGTLQLYAEGYEWDEWKEEEAYKQTDDDVEGSLDELVSHVRQRFDMIGEEIQTAYTFCRQLELVIGKHAGNIVKVDDMVVAEPHQSYDFFRIIV